MFDFPSTPTSGQKYPAAPVAGLPQYTWDGEKWTTIGGATTGAAPSTVAPLMDATPAVVGVSTKYAREDHVHPSDTARVAKAGDTMTGPLNVNAAAPLIGLQAIGLTNQAVLAAYRDGLNRWNVVMTVGPELGGNTGSDFAISRFTDTGSFIDSPIVISRANGRLSLLGDPTSALHAATKNYVDNAAAIVPATAAEYLANSAQKTVTPNTIWSAAQQVTISNAASVSPNLALGSDFIWTVGQAGSTLANPINGKRGQKGLIFLVNSGNVAGWGSAYKFPNSTKPVMSGTTIISYVVGNDAVTMFCTAASNLG